MAAEFPLTILIVLIVGYQVSGSCICYPPPQAPFACGPSTFVNECPAPTVIQTPPMAIPLTIPSVIPLGTFAAVKSLSIKPSLGPGLYCDNNIAFHQTAPHSTELNAPCEPACVSEPQPQNSQVVEACA